MALSYSLTSLLSIATSWPSFPTTQTLLPMVIPVIQLPGRTKRRYLVTFNSSVLHTLFSSSFLQYLLSYERQINHQYYHDVSRRHSKQDRSQPHVLWLMVGAHYISNSWIYTFTGNCFLLSRWCSMYLKMISGVPSFMSLHAIFTELYRYSGGTQQGMRV